MKDKLRINETRLLMENWSNHISEGPSTGGLAGINREKVIKLLKRLRGGNDSADNEEKEDLPGGDGIDDALPADGTDDDAIDIEDKDVIDSGKDLSMGDVMVVMNQLRNTGGLSFEDLGNKMLNQVQSAIKKTIETLSARRGISSQDKQSDAENIEEVGGRILKRLEIAFEKLFEPRTLVNLQEVIKVIKKEERKILNENKKFVITIKG